MNIAILNVPLRKDNQRTIFPPLGAMTVIQSLEKDGHEVDFYDLNFYRPSEKDIQDFLGKKHYPMVGISATVATSYKYVKKLTGLIRRVSPETCIVVGGAMTASSEVLLKYSEADITVIGEGERAAKDIAFYVKEHGRVLKDDELKKITGICYKKQDCDIYFTGHSKPINIDDIADPDYSVLEKSSDIKHYITGPFFYDQFRLDERSHEEKRKGKLMATVLTSRGCVNRCGFCYRAQPGIRVFAVDRVIGHIKFLIQKYNVGFISFGDESFGVSRKWLDEFIEKVSSLDILYRIGGMCCENVDKGLLVKFRQSGCVAIHYGLESGSNRMLTVMEKKANAELNEKAVRWTHEALMQTVPALVIGMPGESYSTIKETENFIKNITENWYKGPVVLSSNILVPLPGTPVYEYARFRGMIGREVGDEEKYLLDVSNKGGDSLDHVNVTDYPYAVVLGWLSCISWASRYAYNKRKIPAVSKKRLFASMLFYHLRFILSPLAVLYKAARADRKLFFKMFLELLAWPLRRGVFKEYVPLRKYLKQKGHAVRIQGIPQL